MAATRSDKAWALDIAGWCRDAKERIEDVTRAVELSLSVKVIMRSPVDTGRFRGNWYPSISAPAATLSPGYFDKAGQGTIDRVASFIASQRGPRVFYLTNNLPYAWPLEEGSSKQAPQGMVRVTVAEFNAVVQAEAEKVRARPRRGTR